jgi:hypothetical protein
MYTREQIEQIAKHKPHHTLTADYQRWRRACVRLGLPTCHELVTPEYILRRNRRYRKNAKRKR